MKPKLKFQLDIEYDRWTCNEFLTFNEQDIFSASILKDHPVLTSCDKMESGARKEFINKFVEKYYEKHRQELAHTLEQAKKDWLKVEDAFFEETDNVFSKNLEGRYSWPKGNYICYLSIFNCNPRFIKEKEFQAYYEHPLGINFVCIHEMLHFIFYNYLEKRFLEQYKECDEKIIWKLSEVFNDVILRTDEFVSLTKHKDPTIYAESGNELIKHQKMWEKAEGNINTFVKNYFSSLEM